MFALDLPASTWDRHQAQWPPRRGRVTLGFWQGLRFQSSVHAQTESPSQVVAHSLHTGGLLEARACLCWRAANSRVEHIARQNLAARLAGLAGSGTKFAQLSGGQRLTSSALTLLLSWMGRRAHQNNIDEIKDFTKCAKQFFMFRIKSLDVHSYEEIYG
jgi:hypothetical protein